MNQKRLVCLCNHVSAQEIKKILLTGALTMVEVQNYTAAGTRCGRCVSEIEALIEKHRKKNNKDPQLKISFE